MFPVLGITNLGPQLSPTVVDTTHAQSGSGTSSAIVRTKRELTVEGIEYVGDIALEQFVKRTFFDPIYMNRELYAIATYPNGSKLEGASKVTALTMPATQMEVMKYTFTLEFQDEIFWTPAYYASGGSSIGFPNYNPN
jgi:predicted secreted protein